MHSSTPGLEIRGCWEPRATLNAPAAPSNICREPKNGLFDIQNSFMKFIKVQLGSLEKNLNFEPCTQTKQIQSLTCGDHIT